MSERPLCIDLFCGLGGWTEGFLAEGWDVIGFDIEQHVYGEQRYPAQLVLQDARTIHGSQLRNASAIVASSPCQEFSYRAMPWKRAKQLPPPHLGMELFAQAARIQREACDAAGRYIPMIQENVRGAQRYMGRAQWHFGSYYLWGDVPALMPIPHRAHKRNPSGENHGAGSWFAIADSKNRGSRSPQEGFKSVGLDWSNRNIRGQDFTRVAGAQSASGTKNGGGSWFNIAHNRASGHGRNPVNTEAFATDPESGTKGGGDWFSDPTAPCRTSSSRSSARRAASAAIAKIPFVLASHIARTWLPRPT